MEPRIGLLPFNQKTYFRWGAKSSSGGAVEKHNHSSLFIDKRCKIRSFNHKKLSRKKGGSLRGRGWKYGSGFVDGVFPVLSPIAEKILNFVQKEVNPNIIWTALDTLPTTHTTWDDIVNVAVQLRLNKLWDPIILVSYF